MCVGSGGIFGRAGGWKFVRGEGVLPGQRNWKKSKFN